MQHNQNGNISTLYLLKKLIYKLLLQLFKEYKFHISLLLIGINILWSCRYERHLKVLKLPTSFDKQFEELRQYGCNKFFTIDYQKRNVKLCHFENDSLVMGDSLYFNNDFVDIGVNDKKLVVVNYSSLTVYNLGDKKIDRTIPLTEDSTTYPYSFHHYFKVSLSDSFLYIENYCTVCADDFRKGHSYPLEKRYNIYTGKAELLEAYPPFVATKYFLKSDNFISRVHVENAIFYIFLNDPKFLRYEILTKKSEEITIKEKIHRPQFVEDTTEFTDNYYSYLMNLVTFSTSNQRIFYNEEDAMIYNFKFLGLSIDSVDAERKFILQQINKNGEVHHEYALAKEDRFNLIFLNHQVFIEKNHAKKIYFEQIPM